jgi:hypothetical protein
MSSYFGKLDYCLLFIRCSSLNPSTYHHLISTNYAVVYKGHPYKTTSYIFLLDNTLIYIAETIVLGRGV